MKKYFLNISHIKIKEISKQICCSHKVFPDFPLGFVDFEVIFFSINHTIYNRQAPKMTCV